MYYFTFTLPSALLLLRLLLLCVHVSMCLFYNYLFPITAAIIKKRFIIVCLFVCLLKKHLSRVCRDIISTTAINN